MIDPRHIDRHRIEAAEGHLNERAAGVPSPTSATIDLSKPMALRAEMARQGLMIHQLLPYEDPERGYVDPLNDPETKDAVRHFMARIWQAALRAEKAHDDADTERRMEAILDRLASEEARG